MPPWTETFDTMEDGKVPPGWILVGTAKTAVGTVDGQKALVKQPGFSREIDPDALEAYLALNWVPSPLDGATPGRANTVTGTPPAIVETLTASPVTPK